MYFVTDSGRSGSIELNVETSEHSDSSERALSLNGIDNSTHRENLDCDVNHDDDGDDVVDLEEENCSDLVPVLEMLNRYCSKVKEEATISSKATERIKKVTLSLLRAIALQTKIQVSNFLRNYGIDFNSLPELENVFSPYLLEHGAPELLARTGLGSDFENLSSREIELGRRRQWKKRKNGKFKIPYYGTPTTF